MKTKNFLVAPLSSWVARGTCALIATIAMQGFAVAQPFVTLAPFEQGVLDGNPPFALTDDCNTAGDDCGNQDGRIRTNDTLEFSWSVTVGGLALDENSDVTTTSIEAVMFEQTLSPLGDAVFEIMTIPAPCLSPPAGTGGTNPASRIIENPDGSIQLLCNLGSAGNGEQRSFSVAVRPLIQSANLSAITSIQSVYGLDQQGNRLTAEYVVDDAAAYEISAAPAYDLIADRSPLSLDGVAIHDIGNGPQPGFIALFTAHIAADPDHGLLGLAELNESVSFRPDVSFTSPQDQLLEDTNWSLLGCRSNEYQWDNSVFGDSAYAQELLQQGSAASNSGNCTITGNRSNGYQVSVDGIDSAGAHYPTATIGGESLLSGPFFVSALSLEIFIPFDEIDKVDSVAGDSAGAITVQACLSEFAPATAVQLVPDQLSSEIQSNNCTNTTTAELDPDGEFSVRNVSQENDAATLTSYLPLISAYHAGDGLLEPEQSFGNMVFYKNTGSAALTEFSTCSVFDNSVLSLTDRAAIGATPGTFAYTGIYTFADSLNAASSDTAQWVVEYGTAEFNGDNPLSDSVSSQTSRDQASGRYSGSWNKLSKLRCDSPAFSWHSDPLLAGIDNINAVRLVPANNESQAVNPDNGTLAIGQEVRLITPLTARDHFNGGPHNGQVIPNGTIAAVFGSWRSTQRHPQWRDNTYDPVTGGGRADGDRMTITRLKLDHDTSTALPIAAPGVETTALAGNPLVWQIQPLLSSSFGAQTAEDVSLFVTLSAGTQYDAGCTLASEFGRAPSLIQASADNAALTELVFNLGDMQVDSTLEPLQICVDTAASAEDAANPGEATQINAYLRADNAVTSAIKTQSVYLDEGGALFATVDAEKSVLLPDEAIKLTLQLRNMRTTTILEKPTLIFVLPFSGDGSGNAARQPASELEGQLQLTHNPELNYRSFAPIEQAGRQLRYTKDSATTLSHNATTDTASWCYFGGNGFYSLEDSNITCPTTWSEVTALRFDATQDLGLRGERTDGIRIDLSLSGPDLKGGDSLNNVFGVSSNSFTQEQLLIARPAVLSVIAFSINGSVFASFNGDYDFDQGIDVGVPDGVPVSLIDVDTGTVLQTVLTTDGRYEFPQLNAGRYRVGLAESVFSPNGLLPRWAPLPAP